MSLNGNSLPPRYRLPAAALLAGLCFALSAPAIIRAEGCEDVKIEDIVLDEGQTLIVPCQGYFIPEARARELLAEEAVNESLEETAAQAQEDAQNASERALVAEEKARKRKGHLWKGVTIGMVLQAALFAAVLAL